MADIIYVLFAASFPAALLYVIFRVICRTLLPPFHAMEHASSPKHAANVLWDWQKRQLVDRSVVAALFDLALTAAWVIGTEFWIFTTYRDTLPEPMRVIHVLIGIGVPLAGLANWFTDAAIFWMLIRKRISGWLVRPVRILTSFRYGTLVVTVVYFILRFEIWVGNALYKRQGVPHERTIAWITVATVLLAFVVARRLTIMARHAPSLLSLQLARDELTAKDILERWGKAGRRAAGATLVLQSALGILYGVTLATLSRELELGGPKWVEQLPDAVAWMAMLAGAFHVAQNIGAVIAVYFGGMGWWVHPMRWIGKIRVALLALVGLYFLGRLDWWIVRSLAAQTPEVPLPWL